MTALSAVYPKVRIECPGVPEPLLEDVVNDAVRDFFRDSEAWRYTVPTLLDWTIGEPFPNLVAGTELPEDTRLHRIDVVKYTNNGVSGQSLRTLPFGTRQEWDDKVSDWETRTASSPYGWTNDPHGAAPRIIPGAEETKAASLQVRAILVPTSALNIIDDYFYDEFHDIWRFGALKRLMKMPDRDWSNPAMARYYEGLEREGVVQAKSQAEAEYGQPNGRTMAYGGL